MSPWLWLLAGAFTEVGWIAGLKLAQTPLAWAGTVFCAVASIGLALGATRALPATTVYNLFIALGAVGAVLFEVFVLGVELRPASYACLALLLVCVIGLKSTDDKAH